MTIIAPAAIFLTILITLAVWPFPFRLDRKLPRPPDPFCDRRLRPF